MQRLHEFLGHCHDSFDKGYDDANYDDLYAAADWDTDDEWLYAGTENDDW